MSPFCWASWSCCRCIAAIERWRTTSAWSARNLFTAGLAPLKIAMPSVLNAIGADRDQIEEAVAEAEKQQVEQNARVSDGRIVVTTVHRRTKRPYTTHATSAYKPRTRVLSGGFLGTIT